MNALDLLDQIEKTSSRNEKEELLAQADGWTRSLLVWAMDPYRTYGLQNIQAPAAPADPVPLNKDMDDMIFPARMGELSEMLDELRTRRLVGKEARELVNMFLRELPAITAKWFHRVIIKDLNCGITAKTVNKVFPGLVPGFDVQLAKDANGVKKGTKFPVFVDYKLDGIRCVAIKNRDGEVQLYTRRGHLIETLPSLVEILSQTKGTFMLDGEVMGRSWNESQSTVFATKNTVDDSEMFYNVFDALTLEEWTHQTCEHPYMVRRAFANDVLKEISHSRVRLVGGSLVGSQALVDDFYSRALAEGHEGIMLKDPEAMYAFKRSDAVLKMKPHSTWEGVIVSWATGEPNSKWRGMFGAFQVRFVEGGPLTSVGGGYTDENRAEFTKNISLNPHHYNGQIIEVKGQELTKDGLVRFPVFVRFRDARDK